VGRVYCLASTRARISRASAPTSDRNRAPLENLKYSSSLPENLNEQIGVSERRAEVICKFCGECYAVEKPELRALLAASTSLTLRVTTFSFTVDH
jgi:hypothetical protein